MRAGGGQNGCQNVTVSQIAHGNWCAARFNKHTAVSPLCLLCGAQGTMEHRVFWCPGFTAQRNKHFTASDVTMYASLSSAELEEWAHLQIPVPHIIGQPSIRSCVGELSPRSTRFYTDGS
eukprot:2094488-Amphidinium_carterae.1